MEENLEYARRLTRAGVSVELHLWAGACHAFEVARNSRVAQAAYRASREAMARFINPINYQSRESS